MMTDEHLPVIAEKAIMSVLAYHDGDQRVVTALQRDLINARIEELLHLKSVAADPDTANVEIVADAAMSWLDLYNLEHGDNPIDEKWMYVCVQSLASIDLKPALVTGRIPRLSSAPPETDQATNSPRADNHELPQNDQAEVSLGADSEDTITHESPVASTSKRDSSTQDEPESPSDYEDRKSKKKTPRAKKRRSNGPQVANSKDPWGDEEITKLIKWKVHGKTHKEIGALLGRTEPACAIRHSIVLKVDKWANFAREYREKRTAGEESDAEGENEVAEEGEDEVPEEGGNEVTKEGEQAEGGDGTNEVEEQKVAEQVMEVSETKADGDEDHSSE